MLVHHHIASRFDQVSSGYAWAWAWDCILICARCAAICLCEKYAMRSGTDKAPIETRLLLNLLNKQAELVCSLILDFCMWLVSWCLGEV